MSIIVDRETMNEFAEQMLDAALDGADDWGEDHPGDFMVNEDGAIQFEGVPDCPTDGGDEKDPPSDDEYDDSLDQDFDDDYPPEDDDDDSLDDDNSSSDDDTGDQGESDQNNGDGIF